MKKFFIAILMVVMMAVPALADVIEIPANVKEIKSVTYSTGGGDKLIQYVKVFCSMKDGREVLFLGKKISLSGAFGVGRWTIPDKIDIVKNPNLREKIIWKD